MTGDTGIVTRARAASYFDWMPLRQKKQLAAEPDCAFGYGSRFVDVHGGQETFGVYPLNVNL